MTPPPTMRHRYTRTNKYQGTCLHCGGFVPSGCGLHVSMKDHYSATVCDEGHARLVKLKPLTP